MKYCLTLIVLLMAMSNALGEKPMQCNIGPVDKYYGGTKWIVYSCADKSTLVIYSYPDNPASPFYFMFYIKDGSYQLYGEGTGNKEYTKATSVELGKLTENDIKALISETINVGNNNNEPQKAPNKAYMDSSRKCSQ